VGINAKNTCGRIPFFKTVCITELSAHISPPTKLFFLQKFVRFRKHFLLPFLKFFAKCQKGLSDNPGFFPREDDSVKV
jgi:hypothetical protein